MSILLGADHRGFEAKNHIATLLLQKGYQVEDVGAFTKDAADDFPLIAKALTDAMTDQTKGILFCGSGVGMSVAANKQAGIRAGLGFSTLQVKAARHDDDINVLVVPTDFISGKELEEMVETFLTTEFGNEEKYERRKEEIEELETHE